MWECGSEGNVRAKPCDNSVDRERRGVCWNRTGDRELTYSGTFPRHNYIDQDIIMPIPHIIELGLLDLLFHYRVLGMEDHNRIYHFNRLEVIIIPHHLGVKLRYYSLSWLVSLLYSYHLPSSSPASIITIAAIEGQRE